MFDPETLETFIRRKPREELAGGAASVPGADGPSVALAAEASGSAAAAGAPKSREERLREFYAERQQHQQSLPEQQPPQQLQERATPQGRLAAAGRDAPEGQLEQRRPLPSAEEEAEALTLKKRGNDLYEAHDYEAAVEHYTLALKAAPSSVLHSNRAAAHMMLGWWDQALRDTRVALRKDPGNDRALERHGKVLLAQDKLEDALRVAADLEARLPEEKRQPQNLPVTVRRLRWLAENAKDPRTLEQCRTLLAEFGTKAELVSPLGVRLRKALTKALIERSDAIDNQRKIRPALARNRRTGADTDEIQEITPLAEEALQVTAELLQDSPEDADVRYWRSRALIRLGRHEEAEQQLRCGLLEEPAHTQLKDLGETINQLEDIKMKGNAAYKEGNLNEAIRLYSLALEKDPGCTDTRTCATLYYNRSSGYRKKGEVQQALEDANMALNLQPKWCKALYRRGILLLECGRYAEALTELKVVQRADPTFDDDLEAWLRRAHNWLAKPRGEVNYYSFMRLPMDSSKEEIRKQYHRLCLLWHPDKSGGTEESRQRFEELQRAYKFLTDDEKRENYDFGIWKDKTVRHHVKRREKVKDSWDDSVNNQEMPFWYDDQLLDDKVECIYWGESGPPAWLQEKRRQFKNNMYGQDGASNKLETRASVRGGGCAEAHGR